MAPSSGSNGTGSSSGYSDDDLLASLASFGVEGQTERDLATIKAMFAASAAAAGPHHPDPAGAARFNGAWAIPQQQQSWQQYQYQQQQPPPNTPTFSKSLELQGGGNFDNNGYYPNGPYFDVSNGQYNNNINKRRDVSLDRDYLRSLSNGGGDGQASTSSNSMDMDESSEDQTNGHHYNHQQQQEYTIPTARNGRHRPSLSHNRNPSIDLMEDIPEDEGQQQFTQQHHSSMPFTSTSPPSTLSEKEGSAGSPGGSGGGNVTQRIEPPMTRSRTRQQQQQQYHVFTAS